jgi:hypothetical protein
MERQLSVTSEEPLSADEWRALISQHPARARRRYCHQVRLVGDERPDLLPSIRAYQRLTGRDPDQFIPMAFIRARQHLERRASDTPAQRAEWLDVQIWGGPLPDADPYASFAGPASLYRAVVLGLRLLEAAAIDLGPEQLFHAPPAAQVDARAIWAAPAPASPDRRGQLRRAWQQSVYKLAVVIEELFVPDPAAPALEQPGQLLPYPDVREWRALILRDPAGARRLIHDLERQRAGQPAEPFNLAESLAAFHQALGG